MIDGFSGVILAGGDSRRMGGGDKAFVEIGGRPIIERSLDLFGRMFGETVIVTNEPGPYRRFGGVTVVPDAILGCGPVGGIHAGLGAISAPMAFFAACDMPFLDGGLILRICEAARGGGAECVVPRSASGMEPLHAVYAKSICPRLEAMLAAGTRRIKDVIDASRCLWFDLAESDLRSVANVNTPEDLAALAGNDRS